MTNLIKCRDVAFSYDGKIVLERVNFEINEGDYLSIIGKNGSGKSTLLKGLLKLKSPSKGNIEFNNVSDLEIGYLPQQSKNTDDFPASVTEVVLSGRLSSLGKRLFYNKYDKDIAYKNMELLGIINLRNKSYRELSGGQKQRVLLARALSSAKKIIVTDEPVSSLDSAAVSEFYSLMDKLNKEQGLTVITVSHDMSASIKYSTHILRLEHEQTFFGTTEDYLKIN